MQSEQDGGQYLPQVVEHSELVDSSRESVATPNRVVIFGSNLSGAGLLAEEFQQYLIDAGIENPLVELQRDQALINEAFYGRRNPEERITLPRGVIAFSEMRQYDPWDGKGMSIRTYHSRSLEGRTAFDDIKKLCQRHKIPLVKFKEGATADHIEKGLKALSPNEYHSQGRILKIGLLLKKFKELI